MPRTKKDTNKKSDGENRIVRFGRKQSQTTRCWFCENGLDPDYKDIEVLRSFLSPRGKILARRITGTCAGHHRTLSSSIKLAREMALIR